MHMIKHQDVAQAFGRHGLKLMTKRAENDLLGLVKIEQSSAFENGERDEMDVELVGVCLSPVDHVAPVVLVRSGIG